MSAELIGILGVGVAIMGGMLTMHRTLHSDITEMRGDIGNLKELMATVEGQLGILVKVFMASRKDTP